MPDPTPLHIVIARQFIPNPDNFRYIDHKNRQKLDDRIENLRWVSSSINACNKTKTKGVIHQYVSELPPGAKPFISFMYKPERADKEGNILPPDIRKLPHLFISWKEEPQKDGTIKMTPGFFTDDSLAEYRVLNKTKGRPTAYKYRDEDRKVVSITASKIKPPPGNMMGTDK
jgi:hypothetical protein